MAGQMFAGIISRDHGEPWGPTGMTSARWMRVPVQQVTIADLIATQPGLLLHALRTDAPTPVGDDPLPHVIAWRNNLYLEDGHHRAARSLLSGRRVIDARVLTVADRDL